MAPTRTTSDSSSWLSKRSFPPDLHLPTSAMRFKLDGATLAKKSAKLTAMLQENSHLDISNMLQSIQAEPDTLELVVRFCHGFDIHMCSENVIPLICLAHSLEMTESHCANNLLDHAATFLEQRVLPSWNESIKALLNLGNTYQQALQLRLIDACSEALAEMALANPGLLGESIMDVVPDPDNEVNNIVYYKHNNTRRKLFSVGCGKSEDLITLPLRIYEPVIRGMIQRQVSLEHVASSLCRYLRKHVCTEDRDSQREVIEVVEKLLPCKKDTLPCTLLFEMLRLASSLDASFDCRNGIETRIGKQLDQATVKDLLPCIQNAKEAQYDVSDSIRRILKGFYGDYTSEDPSGLTRVAELMEGFLVEVAKDRELELTTFISLAEMSTSTSHVLTERCSDGIYRAIDIYITKHQQLTENEKEDICRVLDFQKLSSEACAHAAQSQRLPLRIVVQALFMTQMQLRDTITREVVHNSGRLKGLIVEDEEDEKSNIEELEEDLEGETKTEIAHNCCRKQRKEKMNLWSEMKRKFGCMSSVHDCNCQVKKRKKVHPK